MATLPAQLITHYGTPTDEPEPWTILVCRGEDLDGDCSEDRMDLAVQEAFEDAAGRFVAEAAKWAPADHEGSDPSAWTALDDLDRAEEVREIFGEIAPLEAAAALQAIPATEEDQRISAALAEAIRAHRAE